MTGRRPYAAIGARLRAYRVDQKLTISALAARSLCAESTLLQIETGYTRPSEAVLGRVSGALGLSPDEAADLRRAWTTPTRSGRAAAEDT